MEAFNVKFVGEIEKNPELYNFTIPEYSRRDSQDKSWHNVSMAVNLSGKKYTYLYFKYNYFNILIINIYFYF